MEVHKVDTTLCLKIRIILFVQNKIMNKISRKKNLTYQIKMTFTF